MASRCLAVAALVTAAAGAAVPRTVDALPADGKVVMDGRLDEPCWQVGEWSTGFSFLDLPARLPEVQTSFKVRVDGESVLFGIRAEEPQPGAMRHECRTRDGNVWSDDCVEVMLDPTGERVEYCHVVVNALGTVYDAQMRQGGHVRSVEWDCSVEAAADVGEASWSVEMRLPVVELGLNASSVGNWAVNVTRARRARGVELSSFAPLTGGFHQPSLFAVLRVPGDAFGRFLWEIRSPYEATAMPEGGKLSYAARVHIRNAGPRFRFFRVRGLLEDTAGDWGEDGLDGGQEREYAFRVPVARQGKQTLTLELAERPGDTLLAVRRFPVDVRYTPIALDIRRPWYRNSIYATEQVDAIECVATIALPDADLPELALRATLTAAAQGEAGNDAIARTAPIPAQRQVHITLPIPPLAAGEYTFAVALEQRLDGAQSHAARVPIRKLPRVADEWRIDERNVLRHNGEEVLPFGWFSIPTRVMAEEGHAYRLMQEYNAQYKRTREEIRAYLDTVREAGTYVTLYPYPSPAMMNPASVWGRPLSNTEADALRGRLDDIKDHPGVFAWYMADEPELRPALPERLRAIYEVCRDTDPHHPCIMLNDTIAGIFQYVDGGDILMPDPYPCFLRNGLAAQPIEKTAAFVKACREAGQGRRAVWVTPQAFNYGDYGRRNQRGPNLVELRNQLYQAVVYGAKGFLWYTYAHTANYPDLDLGMRWLSFEVADLKAAILADAAGDIAVAVDAPEPSHMHVSARRVGDDIVLFAVNTATVPQQVRLTPAGARATTGPEARTWHVVSENRSLTLEAEGVLRDRFGTYETHIYTTDPDLARRETLAAVAARIAAADAARRRPGNVAFEDFGTTVEVSSKSRYGSTPDRVLDGVRGGMQWRSDPAAKGPDWLLVRWPEAQRIARVVVYTDTIAACEMEAPEGEGWRSLGAARATADDRIEAVFPQAVTAALRIRVSERLAEQTGSTIREVEAYAE
ncbi:MAG: hypothetical protein JXR77_11555 [Lentisphaeria bacterium]|nr:hypothetical protein [Lentisphaeria bacterium]